MLNEWRRRWRPRFGQSCTDVRRSSTGNFSATSAMAIWVFAHRVAKNAIRKGKPSYPPRSCNSLLRPSRCTFTSSSCPVKILRHDDLSATTQITRTARDVATDRNAKENNYSVYSFWPERGTLVGQFVVQVSNGLASKTLEVSKQSLSFLPTLVAVSRDRYPYFRSMFYGVFLLT